MKRRSARPVVVEVKRTRSSTSSLADAFGRNRSGAGLWQGVPLRVDAPTSPRREPEPRPILIVTAEPDSRPAPRVLPSLVPMYVPSEPEPLEEAAKASPASRRPRAARRPSAPRTEPEAASTSPEPTVAPEVSIAPPATVEPSAASLMPPEHAVSPTQPRTDRRERGERQPELRRGERWKRRLPRACW